MMPSRHVLPLFAAVVVIAAASRAAVAVASDPVAADGTSAADGTNDGDAGADDAAIAVALPAAPAAFVEASGAASGSLPVSGEARTTWRYGRARGVAVDEATNRLRVSGAGRTLDGAFHGLSIGFSVALLVPSLRAGTYVAGAALPGVAAAWARQDRAAVTADIEWDSSARDAGPASVVVTVTSVAELSHSSERRGGVTVDVTDFRIHGSLQATLPCTRSVAALRQSCRPETIRGAF